MDCSFTLYIQDKCLLTWEIYLLYQSYIFYVNKNSKTVYSWTENSNVRLSLSIWKVAYRYWKPFSVIFIFHVVLKLAMIESRMDNPNRSRPHPKLSKNTVGGFPFWKNTILSTFFCQWLIVFSLTLSWSGGGGGEKGKLAR